MKLFLSAIFIFLSTTADAQTTFFKVYDDTTNGNIYSMKKIGNDFIAAGRVASNSMVMRLHENGDTVWTCILSNPDFSLETQHICITTDSNIIALTFANGTSIQNLGISYIHLVKLNSATGDTIWTTVTGTVGPVSIVSPHSIDFTSDGGCIVSATMENSLTYSNAALLRFNSSGNLMWRKSYALNSINSLTFSGPVKHTSDGGFLYVASVPDSRDGDFLLMKTDSAGNVDWSKLRGKKYEDKVNDILVRSDNNYLLLGTTYVDTITVNDVFLSMLDTSGNTLWTKTYGTPATYGDFGMRVSETLNGEFIWGGGSQPAMDTFYPFIINTDANGDSLWTFMSQDTSVFYFYNDVNETSDGYISGCEKFYSVTHNSIALARISSSGNWNCYPQQYPIIKSSVQFSDTAHNIQNTQLLTGSFPVFATQISKGFPVSSDCIITSNISIEASETFSIYPNPVNDQFTILLNQPLQNAELIIYDATSRIVQREKLNSQTSIIKCRLSVGIYIVKLFLKDFSADRSPNQLSKILVIQ